jgi:Ran GTPase-activating protein (RanGAP) involved in mRNA processing and transport
MDYEILWRNKYLTMNATTLDEMIGALQQAVDELKAMKAAGVTLDQDSDMGGDFARLVTSNPRVAEQLGFEISDVPEDEEFDEKDDLDEDEEGEEWKKM